MTRRQVLLLVAGALALVGGASLLRLLFRTRFLPALGGAIGRVALEEGVRRAVASHRTPHEPSADEVD